jgi:hypothetical protein
MDAARIFDDLFTRAREADELESRPRSTAVRDGGEPGASEEPKVRREDVQCVEQRSFEARCASSPAWTRAKGDCSDKARDVGGLANVLANEH